MSFIFLKNVASKLFTGFLYGIGISIALTIFFFSFEKGYSKLSNKKDFEYLDFDETVELEIINHSIIKSSDQNIEIIGALYNKSEANWSGMEIEIELFDEQKNFVYECSDKLMNIVSPSQKENFKISCGSCDKAIPEYSSYSLKVINAYGKKQLN